MNDFDAEYEDIAVKVQGLKVFLDSLVQVLLEVQGIQCHSVTSRVKSKASVRQKIQRTDKERTLNDLTDILGVRIITYFQDQVETVSRLIERQFTVDPGNSSDKRTLLDPDRFGYLSVHYVLQLNEERLALPENYAYRGIKFELQIRSILQHAWAEIEHDLGYKSGGEVPDTVRRRFSRLAGLLELADDEFFGIREDLARAELARAASPKRSRAAEIQSEIEWILARPAPFALPSWNRSWNEMEYLAYIENSDRGFLMLDRTLLAIPSSHGRFEPCDLLGPNDELIHVARARDSGSFGHLFNQAFVSTEILCSSANARQEFIGVVEERGNGRRLAPGFYPKEVVLAFPSEDGPTVPMERIPPFSRFTLARVAEELEERSVTLRLIGIKKH